MADTFTPTAEGAYSFNQDTCDNLKGDLPSGFSASYTTVTIANKEGAVLIENAKKPVSFSLSYEILDDITGGTGSGFTAIEKYEDLFALRGKIGNVSKSGRSLSGVVLLDVTPPVYQNGFFRGVEARKITCNLSMQKVD